MFQKITEYSGTFVQKFIQEKNKIWWSNNCYRVKCRIPEWEASYLNVDKIGADAVVGGDFYGRNVLSNETDVDLFDPGDERH